MSDIATRLRRAAGVYDASYPPSVLALNDPHVDTLTPSTVSAAAGPTTITVAGSNFTAGSVIEINQAAAPTTFVSATSLTTSYDPTVAGTVTFTVRNPNNEESNSVPFVVGALGEEPGTQETGPEPAPQPTPIEYPTPEPDDDGVEVYEPEPLGEPGPAGDED